MQFFFVGFLKSKEYVNKLQTISELMEEIKRIINDMLPDVCE